MIESTVYQSLKLWKSLKYKLINESPVHLGIMHQNLHLKCIKTCIIDTFEHVFNASWIKNLDIKNINPENYHFGSNSTRISNSFSHSSVSIRVSVVNLNMIVFRKFGQNENKNFNLIFTILIPFSSRLPSGHLNV